MPAKGWRSVSEDGAPTLPTTDRRYAINLGTLDDESLREFQRLVRDLDHGKRMAEQQARLQPWRR